MTKGAADFIDRSLSAKLFLRTFSYREILTVVTVSCCLVAGIEVYQYYKDERFIQNWSLTIGVVGVTLMLLTNHVYYRFEHARSNNLLGRSIFDFMFLLCFYLIKSTYLSIIRQNNQFSFEVDGWAGALGIFLGVPILVFAFEFLVSLLKYLLKWARCHVL